MRKIKRFDSFNESVVLQMISETILYLMPEIKSTLSSMAEDGDEIAIQLLKKSGVDTLKDITLVELEGERLSFMNKAAIDSHNPEFMDQLNRGYEISDKSANTIKNFSNRNQMKIGKFVTAMLGPIPNKELEDFVNRLKSNKSKGYDIKTVEGDEIKKYYRTESMFDNGDSDNIWGSELVKSCMRDKEKFAPGVFDIYTKNPEVCKLVVMLNERGLLVSRALLWKVSKVDGGIHEERKQLVQADSKNVPESFWFMDRIYSTKEWMDKSMSAWGEKNGYAVKRGNWGARNLTINGVDSRCDMEVAIKKIAYKGFPYMDTFTYYDVKNGKLRNFDSPDFKGFGLQSTAGNYSTTTGHGPVFRNYIRRFIK